MKNPGRTTSTRDNILRMGTRVAVIAALLAALTIAAAGHAMLRASDGGGATKTIGETPVITAPEPTPEPSTEPDPPASDDETEVVEGPTTDGDVGPYSPAGEDEQLAGVAVDEEQAPDEEAPDCAEIWVAGQQLPKTGYDFCLTDGGVTLGILDRADGSTLAVYDGRLYAVPGGTIRGGDDLGNDPGYAAAFEACDPQE